MDVAQSATDSPLYDTVLADVLAEARDAVWVAELAAKQFRAALAVGAAKALEQQAERRAQQLVGERTAVLSARVVALERLLRHQGDTLASAIIVTPAEAPVGPVMKPPAPSTKPASVQPAPAKPDPVPPAPAVRLTTTAAATAATVTAAATAVETATAATTVTAPGRPTAATTPGRPTTTATTATPVRAADITPVRPAVRRAKDTGPTAADVPSVPSMKDIFSSTRAASWLDGLLGAKR